MRNKWIMPCKPAEYIRTQDVDNFVLGYALNTNDDETIEVDDLIYVYVSRVENTEGLGAIPKEEIDSVIKLETRVRNIFSDEELNEFSEEVILKREEYKQFVEIEKIREFDYPEFHYKEFKLIELHDNSTGNAIPLGRQMNQITQTNKVPEEFERYIDEVIENHQ